MIFRRKSPEEQFAEELAKELERQAKEAMARLSPEARKRIELAERNSEAWRRLEERIGRGEVEVYVKEIDGERYFITYETFKNFPFKRYKDYLLLPSGLENYFHGMLPKSYDWVMENAETWKPRALAMTRQLNEPIEVTGYDGFYNAIYTCVVEARDGRRFLAGRLDCMLLELADGSRTAVKIVAKAVSQYARGLWNNKLKKAVQEGKMTREEAQKILEGLVNDAYLSLAIMRDLGLLV